MRDNRGNLIGDLSDNINAKTSGSIVRFLTSSIDENATVYDLLPVIINKPPIITADISEASFPPIKPYTAIDYLRPRKTYMYKTAEQTIRVVLGSTVNLSVKASQPKTLNVENGIPKLIAPNVGLTYSWEKDNTRIFSETLPRANSKTTISDNTIVITNVQPVHEGSYVCKISNDAGTVYSETIELEVYNPYNDTAFYTNLIQNPYGADGLDNWETISNELITKPLKEGTQTTALIEPNLASNQFGYTVDFFHPRPYQISSTTPARNTNLSENLSNTGGFYFTRDRFKYLKKGGLYVAKAYQDVNITGIEPFVKGGIHGVSGVRAVFSCYLGNGLSFLPTIPLISPLDSANAGLHDMSQPRISYQNYSLAGPSWGPDASVYITIEEFQNGSRVPSTYVDEFGNQTTSKDPIMILDPWATMMNKHKGKSFGAYSDSRATTLHAARDLYPDVRYRPANGQYAGFNRVVIPQLNPKTTKIRITMVFETEMTALQDLNKEVLETSDEIYKTVSWQGSAQVGSLDVDNTPLIDRIKKLPTSFETGSGGNIVQKPLNTIAPFYGEPRIMATGFNLVLLPVYSDRQQVTEKETNGLFNINNVPASAIIPPRTLR